MSKLIKKNILLGITGSIAAYKAADIASTLKKNNCDVKVVMTKSSMSFITETTLECITSNPVITDDENCKNLTNFTHIDLAKWAYIILIAPCTANFINKLANGYGDDLLSTICLASTKQIFVAPAMNPNMWNNPITQKNIKNFDKTNISIIGPDYGLHACGDTGYGRLMSPDVIVEHISQSSNTKEFSNINLLITAGPTREPIDPVRFISNYSSGKMGYSLAEIAKEMGGNVELISGPVKLDPIKDINTTYVETSDEMLKAVESKIKSKDIFISTAAIADYRPSSCSTKKFKKSDENLTIKFSRGIDILKKISEEQKNLFTVGFAAETENLDKNMNYKLTDKGLDIIVGNIANHQKKVGFENDTNEIIIASENERQYLEKDTKITLAMKILLFISKEYKKKLSIINTNVK